MNELYGQLGELFVQIERQAQAVNASRGRLVMEEQALAQLQQKAGQIVRQINERDGAASNGDRLAEQSL